MTRKCANCESPIPAETEHFIYDDSEIYCTACVEVSSYTAYTYYVDGEYLGCSEEETVRHVESSDDDYEEGE